MPVIYGNYTAYLPFTGNLREVSGLLYDISTKKDSREIDFLGKMNNYCLGEDWLLRSKTHCLATAKQEFTNGFFLARLTD